jgi:hypothetical protein
MKAILSPSLERVLRVVPDETPTRPEVTRTLVDLGTPPPAFNPYLEELAEVFTIGPAEVVRTVVVRALAEPLPCMVEALAFSNRLTPEEWEGIEAMAAQSPAVRHALRRLTRASTVDLLDPALPALFGAAVGFGVLAPGRPAEILALP